jgi:hypothetical protein
MADLNEWPKAYYHKDGGYRAVASEEEASDLGDGWGTEPHNVHLTGGDPALRSVPTAYLGQSSSDMETLIRRVIREELGAWSGDESPASGDEPRRRGRPPGSRNRAAVTATDGVIDNG